jgi:GDP-4-dehydro-6-deoxy-D-mannose reductase
MNTLIIGGSGFVGTHMQTRSPDWSCTTAVGRDVDIRDREALKALVRAVKPSYVVNLASITTVKEASDSPKDSYDISFYGTLNILEVLKEYGFDGTFLYISSSEVYGHPSVANLPLTEDSALLPMNQYSVGKIAAEYLCSYWHNSNNFKTIIVRPFTHIGPGQSDRFSIASFASQISKILLNNKNPMIEVGNLDTTRDFTDVRDIVDAYWLLLKLGRGGEVYNVCSGQEVTIRSVLQKLICVSEKEISIQVDLERLRNTEQQRVFGCAKKIYETTGWSPIIDINNTLTDTLNYWLKIHGK